MYVTGPVPLEERYGWFAAPIRPAARGPALTGMAASNHGRGSLRNQLDLYGLRGRRALPVPDQGQEAPRRGSAATTPLPPGTGWSLIPDEYHPREGMISAVLPRRTRLVAMEQEGQGAAGHGGKRGHRRLRDEPCIPPVSAAIHRPADRGRGNRRASRPIMVMNKSDLRLSEDVAERLAHYHQMGYAVHRLLGAHGRGP